MNCRPDDLAIVVNTGIWPELRHMLGKIRRVKKMEMAWDGPAWTYKGRKFVQDGLVCYAIPDSWLRPIRDNDGQDETLSWKAVPKSDPVHLIANDAGRALRAASNHALRLVVGTAPTELGRPL